MSPRMPSMLCLAFFSPSSSFLSASSSSSFFPNLILSTRLIELTKPQKFKGKRAGISRWGLGGRPPGALGEVTKRVSPLNTLRGTHTHPSPVAGKHLHLLGGTGTVTHVETHRAGPPKAATEAPLVPPCHACARLDPSSNFLLDNYLST